MYLVSILLQSLVSSTPFTHNSYPFQPLLVSLAVEGFSESHSKEIVPAWNIKFVVVEPGMFQTEWAQSAVVVPIEPQYAAPDTPTSIFRQMIQRSWFGDLEKAAQVLLRIAKEPNPPLRLQLGTDCVVVTSEKAKSIIEDNKKWAELGHTTNVDGLDKEKLIEELLAYKP